MKAPLNAQSYRTSEPRKPDEVEQLLLEEMAGTAAALGASLAAAAETAIATTEAPAAALKAQFSESQSKST